MELELPQNQHSPCPAGLSPPGWAHCWKWTHQSRAVHELLINVGCKREVGNDEKGLERCD